MRTLPNDKNEVPTAVGSTKKSETADQLPVGKYQRMHKCKNALELPIILISSVAKLKS